MRFGNAVALSIVVMLLSTGARADGWTADKLRGVVMAQQEGQWVVLKRGDVVADSRLVRATNNGYAEFTRNGESISLAPNTMIEIHETAGQHFTAVGQYKGNLTITDNHEDRPHFAVVTPFIAAVVKGTTFSVRSRAHRTTVSVSEGNVAVEDTTAHTFVSIGVGQHASAGPNQTMVVGGTGHLPPIHNAQGAVVSTVTASGDVVAGTLDEHGNPVQPVASSKSSSTGSPAAKGKDGKAAGPKDDKGHAVSPTAGRGNSDKGHSEGNGGGKGNGSGNANGGGNGGNSGGGGKGNSGHGDSGNNGNGHGKGNGK